MRGMSTIKNILSIAGSDPSGGAGIQADLKTITSLGGYGMAAITSLTAQNTQGVQAVLPVEAEFVSQQLHSIFSDIRVDAVKIGMLGDERVTTVVADALLRYQPKNIILDPVLVATSGDRLTQQGAIDVILRDLAPLATLVTPNVIEGEVMLRKSILDVDLAAQELSAIMGGVPVLLKGGHLKGDKSIDTLCFGNDILKFDSDRIETKNTHGTGCTLSSALATYLAQGNPIYAAIEKAKAYITQAILTADDLDVAEGTGHGPVNHLHAIIKAS